MISCGELEATRDGNQLVIKAENVETFVGDGSRESSVLDDFAQESMENPLNGITIDDTAVRCNSCSEVWFPRLRGNGCFYPGWDKCPTGCNDPEVSES
jgi:hypothetical protein